MEEAFIIAQSFQFLLVYFVILFIRSTSFKNSFIFKIRYRYFLLSIIILYFITIFFDYKKYTGSREFMEIFALILAPISEEILYRGVLIGVLFDVISKITKKKFQMTIFFVLIIVQGILFIFNHNQFTIHLLVMTIIYTLLFVLSKRNLVPGILVHSLNNIFAFMK